ncbi:hypothetical protein NKG94_24390 [Micromonospora sp. M12]
MTAAQAVLALHLAGRTDAALYVGSWSNWVADRPGRSPPRRHPAADQRVRWAAVGPRATMGSCPTTRWWCGTSRCSPTTWVTIRSTRSGWS